MIKKDISIQELLDHLSQFERDDVISYAAVASLLEKLGYTISPEEE
ncbi:hypothetical protein AB3N04_12775 [Alkalihalophilus sp. As8PL]|uniref:Uncharacterized protein n=1 Tax=Alkalihalophilus sp. As8PL TaxID=3237103 RepID=A0AB39BP27_9BACI